MPWASYQIRKIAGCACAGNAGTFPPPQTSKQIASLRFRHASRHMHHARAVMHVGIADPRWLGKMFPAFPAHAHTAILRIWQEAHAGMVEYMPQNYQYPVTTSNATFRLSAMLKCLWNVWPLVINEIKLKIHSKLYVNFLPKYDFQRIVYKDTWNLRNDKVILIWANHYILTIESQFFPSFMDLIMRQCKRSGLIEISYPTLQSYNSYWSIK